MNENKFWFYDSYLCDCSLRWNNICCYFQYHEIYNWLFFAAYEKGRDRPSLTVYTFQPPEGFHGPSSPQVSSQPVSPVCLEVCFFKLSRFFQVY